MNWFNWFLVGFFALSTLLFISRIGKQEKPSTPTHAVIHTVIMGLLISGVILLS